MAVGDMARCGVSGSTEVGLLLDRLPQKILGLGDYAYENGSVSDFANCFEPPFGRHKTRFSPSAGNHDYNTQNATPYFNYFGAAAGDPTKGYYSQTHGDWQILFLNSNCWQIGCGVNDPQYTWLQAELASASAAACRAVVMHHPRWSSWGPYASQDILDPMMSLLDDYNADLVLTGHAHHYERLVKLDATRTPSSSGWRQFTVGTGGAGLRVPQAGDVLAESAVLITNANGVLALSLDAGAYSWEFVTTENQVLDSGSDSCNN